MKLPPLDCEHLTLYLPKFQLMGDLEPSSSLPMLGQPTQISFLVVALGVVESMANAVIIFYFLVILDG